MKEMIEKRIALAERVRDFLMAQGKPSMVGENKCMYRTSEGLKCAVGCLMSDEEYKSEYEHFTTSSPRLNPFINSLSDSTGISFAMLKSDLSLFQGFHDSYYLKLKENAEVALFSVFIETKFNTFIESLKN